MDMKPGMSCEDTGRNEPAVLEIPLPFLLRSHGIFEGPPPGVDDGGSDHNDVRDLGNVLGVVDNGRTRLPWLRSGLTGVLHRLRLCRGFVIDGCRSI